MNIKLTQDEIADILWESGDVGVDDEIVWDLVTNRCPELLEAANDMLSTLPPD